MILELQHPTLETLIKRTSVLEAMEILDKLLDCYSEQQLVSFATVEGNQPRVRPMTLIKLDGRFYMITGARGGRDAKKLEQIRENPRFEYHLVLEGADQNGFIRGMGETWEVEDRETKSKVYDKITWAANFFDSVDHPDYVLLELRHTGFSYRWPDTREICYLTL